MSMKMQPCFKIGIELLKRDIHFFLNQNQNIKKPIVRIDEKFSTFIF